MPEAPPSRSLPKTIFGSGEGFAYLMLERSGWLVVTRNYTRNPAKASPERGGARRSGRRGSLGSRLRRSRHPSKAPSPLPRLTSRNTVRTGTYAAPRYSPAYGRCCGTRSRWSRRKWSYFHVSSSGHAHLLQQILAVLGAAHNAAGQHLRTQREPYRWRSGSSARRAWPR